MRGKFLQQMPAALAKNFDTNADAWSVCGS